MFGKIGDLAKAVGKVAPVLGNFLTGGAAGLALDVVASALGVNRDDEDALIRAAANPENAQALLEAQNAHKERLLELQIQWEQNRLLDVQSARQRQAASEEATGKRDIHIYIIAYIFLFGFFGLICALLFVDIPIGNKDIVNILFGSLASGTAGILGYFYGSSKGSSDKNQLIGRS